MKKIIFLFMAVCSVAILHLTSCSKDPSQTTGIDKELYEMAKISTGSVWFKNSSALLKKSSGSAHPQPFLRTRYNSIAAAKLDLAGKIMVGTTFPEGSLIVKELYDNTTTLGRYAVLYKKSGSAEADSKGWVWGYINADGSVAEPASNKGSGCISCHSQADNIDYMLMNKYFQ